MKLTLKYGNQKETIQGIHLRKILLILLHNHIHQLLILLHNHIHQLLIQLKMSILIVDSKNHAINQIIQRDVPMGQIIQRDVPMDQIIQRDVPMEIKIEI
jgi:hypothetical protein